MERIYDCPQYPTTTPVEVMGMLTAVCFIEQVWMGRVDWVAGDKSDFVGYWGSLFSTAEQTVCVLAGIHPAHRPNISDKSPEGCKRYGAMLKAARDRLTAILTANHEAHAVELDRQAGAYDGLAAAKAAQGRLVELGIVQPSTGASA